jgi:hypothetical protein
VGNTPRETPPELVEKIIASCPEEIVVTGEEDGRIMTGTPSSHFRSKHSKEAIQRYQWWSPEARIKVVTLYMVLGNAAKVAKATGIPAGTIRRWKMEPWWTEIMQRVRSDKNDELDTQITKIIEKAMKEVEDRLQNGEYVYDGRSQSMVRIPVKTVDAVRTVNTLFDKRALIRGEPTKRTEQTSVNDKLKKMAEEFAKFAKARTVNGKSETISEEPVGSSTVSG